MPKKGGFTLVEVLVSIMVFTTAMVSLLQVYLASSTASKRAEYAYTAHNLAKSHLERLKTLDFSLLPTAAETSTRINKDGDPDENGDFIRSTAISTAYLGYSNLTQATVSVYYLLKGKQCPLPMQLTTVILHQ